MLMLKNGVCSTMMYLMLKMWRKVIFVITPTMLASRNQVSVKRAQPQRVGSESLLFLFLHFEDSQPSIVVQDAIGVVIVPLEVRRFVAQRAALAVRHFGKTGQHLPAFLQYCAGGAGSVTAERIEDGRRIQIQCREARG